MTDYYAVLGVSREAGPSILRIAYEGKLKALAKSQLSEAEQKAEAKQIEAAFATLSDPLRRERHDERLEAAVRKEERSARMVPIVAAGVLLALGVAGYMGYSWKAAENKKQLARLEQERIRAERERVALEAETERVKKEAEESATKEKDRESYQARYGSSGSSRYRYSGSSGGYSQPSSEQMQAVQGAVEAMSDWERRAQEERDRYQAQAELARARAEAERQAQWVRDRQAEEERLRAERAAR